MDDCDDVIVDPGGNLVLACHCTSNDLPLAAAREGAAREDGMDGFVIKLDPRSGRVLFASRLGGSSHDATIRVATDAAGNSYAVGLTNSANFPTTPDALQPAYGGGDLDGFLVKLDPSGRVVYSTFLGGSGVDEATDLVLDPESNRLYVSGRSKSPNLPGSELALTKPGGDDDGFVMALEADAKTLRWLAYLGGSQAEKITGIRSDGKGSLFVAGYTGSEDFPARAALQSKLKGKTDAFLAKLDAATGEVTFATYFGGAGEDSAWGLALDSAADPHICVITNSPEMPSTPNAFQKQFSGIWDAFLAKFDPLGERLVYGTYYGGSGDDQCGYDGHSLAVDATGRAWMAGMTSSQDLPVKQAHQPAYGGGELDGFVAVVSEDGSALSYATYYGGDSRDLLEGLAVSGGHVYVTGLAESRNLASIGNAVRPGHAGGRFDVMLLGFQIP